MRRESALTTLPKAHSQAPERRYVSRGGLMCKDAKQMRGRELKSSGCCAFERRQAPSSVQTSVTAGECRIVSRANTARFPQCAQDCVLICHSKRFLLSKRAKRRVSDVCCPGSKSGRRNTIGVRKRCQGIGLPPRRSLTKQCLHQFCRWPAVAAHQLRSARLHIVPMRNRQ